MSVSLAQPAPADPDRDAIIETVRRFAEEHIEPVRAELDAMADPMACFSWDIIEAADAIGLRTMPLAEAYGGIGVGVTEASIILEEVHRSGGNAAACCKRTCGKFGYGRYRCRRHG